MKLRTSYFDGTVLKKQITRFAPVWGLYSAFLLMLFMVAVELDSQGVRTASNLAETISGFAVGNCIYAFAVAQLLWGDLYNSRMCNALHALPLRREGWFFTGTTAGLLFALVPNGLFALAMGALCGELWPVALLWLGAVMLQYLCFFGLATLSAFLVGNRFAAGLLYVILNFFAMIAYFLLDELYLPNLPSIILRNEHFVLFTPVVQMAENYDIVQVSYDYALGAYRNAVYTLGEGWGYTGICAGLGVIALGLALLCYRKRHLEYAGDLVAVKPLEPVVLGIYTLCITALCYGFLTLFWGYVETVYTVIGLFIGFFTGKMLLERQVRVFRKKNLLAFLLVAVLFYGSIGAAAWDVLGIVSWVPKAENVASVSISTGGSYYYQENGITLENQEDIAAIISVQQEGMLHRRWDGEDNTVQLQLTYEMESGMRRSREYSIPTGTEAGKTLKAYLSSPEAVLEELQYMGDFIRAEFYDPGIEITDTADLAALREAILADCEAGNMAQDWGFYRDAEEMYYMSLEFRTAEGIRYYRELRFWDGCTNIMDWVAQQGIAFTKYE